MLPPDLNSIGQQVISPLTLPIPNNSALAASATTPSSPLPHPPLIRNTRVRNNLPHVPVLALEVEPAPLVQVVELPVRPRARPAPEGDSLVPDPLQNRVELLVRGQEGLGPQARMNLSMRRSIHRS